MAKTSQTNSQWKNYFVEPLHAERENIIKKPFDIYLLGITLFLVFVGVVMIFSSSAILAKDEFGDTYYFLKKEIIYFAIGLLALFIAKSIPYHAYKKWIYPILILSAGLMLLCFVPGLSHSAKGANRWIRFMGFSLQPSEIVKISVVIFVAYMIAKKGDKIREFLKGYIPVVAVSGMFILLILAQKDLGSAFVLASIIFIMLFVGRTRLAYLLGSCALAGVLMYYAILTEPFRVQRILAYADPWKYQFDSGFQILQSWVAFQSGGIYGVGLGEGQQKLYYLPEAHTDFIFSVFGEEFGMIGVITVVSLFLLFIFNGLKIASRAIDNYGTLLAVGITSLIGFQAFINFGVVMGILPTKGLTLPFISYGGTSLILSMFSVGILLNISSFAREEK